MSLKTEPSCRARAGHEGSQELAFSGNRPSIVSMRPIMWGAFVVIHCVAL